MSYARGVTSMTVCHIGHTHVAMCQYGRSVGIQSYPHIGAKKLLVVKVDAQDSVLLDSLGQPLSLDQLRANVFGGPDDSVNLVERYQSCSYGKTIFEAFEDAENGVNGVMKLTIEENANGNSNQALQNAATSKLFEVLGPGFLGSPRDTYVMLMLPPGTGSWLAYAYVNWWLSVYNGNTWSRCYARPYLSRSCKYMLGSCARAIRSMQKLEPHPPHPQVCERAYARGGAQPRAGAFRHAGPREGLAPTPG